MPSYLLDTNHLGIAVSRGSDLAKKIDASLLAGNRFGTCLPVLCEIEAGRRQVKNHQQYRANLTRLLRQFRVWPMDVATTRNFGDIHVEVKRAGRVLSSVDMMIAAIARQLNLTILTTDLDFTALPTIRTENWL
jgi:predicted nucleic acid-binding protein